jgi:hypothetical protein
MPRPKKVSTPKKQVKSFFKERKEFIKRLLDGSKSSNFALDMMTATKVFEKFNNDLDFLSKVKPLFKLNGTIKWLLTADGIKFLDLKYKEFKYKPKKSEILIDSGEKFGDDIVKPRPRTIRQFLDNE